MIVTNTLARPVTLHGCVPAINWTFEGCMKSDEFELPKPEVFTVMPNMVQVIDHADEEYGLLWDDPPGVNIHWQYGC